jgi:hypothetical protein
MTESKAYPYPLLRNWVDDYSQSKFTLRDLVMERDGGDTILRVELELDDVYLNEQIIDGKLAMAIEVNCRETMLSRWIPLTAFSEDLRFSSDVLCGKFSVQAFLVSLTDRSDFMPMGINSEFETASFEVNVGDPVAISLIQDAAINFTRKSQGDSLIVRHIENMGQYEYSIDTSGDSIVVSTGEKTHYYYLALSGDKSSKTHLFQSIYKDAVVFAIVALAENPENSELAWGQSLQARISALGRMVPDYQDLENVNLLALEIVGPDGIGKVRNVGN